MTEYPPTRILLDGGMAETTPATTSLPITSIIASISTPTPPLKVVSILLLKYLTPISTSASVAECTFSYASSPGSGLLLLLIRMASSSSQAASFFAASSLKNTAVLAFDLASKTPVVVAPVRSSATAPINGILITSSSNILMLFHAS